MLLDACKLAEAYKVTGEGQRLGEALFAACAAMAGPKARESDVLDYAREWAETLLDIRALRDGGGGDADLIRAGVWLALADDRSLPARREDARAAIEQFAETSPEREDYEDR